MGEIIVYVVWFKAMPNRIMQCLLKEHAEYLRLWAKDKENRQVLTKEKKKNNG